MNALSEVAPAFAEMAHRIVWCSAASVDDRRRPRSRIIHPIWQWDGQALLGWIGTSPTPLKRAHLATQPLYVAELLVARSRPPCGRVPRGFGIR